ncbi:MAG: SMP-30/gluconolactonase/LRE family protein [Solirubrobacteraceae bacterium]
MLDDAALHKISANPMVPGASGIKAGDGRLYGTNTDAATVYSVPLSRQGELGPPELIAEHLRGDDIALDIDGRLYLATHIENSVVRLDPDGTRTAIAGPEQGMAGSTSAAFGPTGDEASLYVLTTGGAILPLNGVVQPAKFVRLDTGAAGRPITWTA